MVIVPLSAALLFGLLFAYYGKEKQYYFTKNEVEAAKYLYDSAPAGSLLIEGSRNYPSQFRNNEFFTYVPLAREMEEVRVEAAAHPVELFSRWLDNDRYAATYLIITRSQKATVDILGLMPVGALDAIERYLDKDGKQLLEEMRGLVEAKNDLDFHYANGGLLKLWLFFHIPATYALIVAVIVHIVVAYAFSTGIA